MTVKVNDQQPLCIAWPPETVELTGLKGDGSDRLEITVFSHRRNAFGPFYLKNGWMDWIGSKSFHSDETGGKKVLVECGLLAAPEIQQEI